ncbi:MAG: hypothetical protein JXX14_11985 [Deltaproteobacteria bacterium]|nr:hypothetical protein [Deltaproteobacteria bacterium]
MFTLEGEVVPADLESDMVNTWATVDVAYCEREIVDCRYLEISEAVSREELVRFAEKILTWRDCEMVLLIPADSPLHEGMAEALAVILSRKRRKRIWLHYTVDEAINLLHLIQRYSPEPEIRALQSAV